MNPGFDAKIFAAVLLATFFSMPGLGHATQCFECTTYLTAWCRDPFDYVTPVQPTNCTHNIIPQKHSTIAVLENLFAVLGSGDRDENGSGLNDLRRRRVASLLARYRRDVATLEAMAWGGNGTRERGRERERRDATTPEPHEKGFKCFKIAFLGARNTYEVFRGCEPVEKLDVCDLVLNYNEKGYRQTRYCDVCDNDEGDDPNPDNAPPCNRAATYRPSSALAVAAAIYAAATYRPSSALAVAAAIYAAVY